MTIPKYISAALLLVGSGWGIQPPGEGTGFPPVDPAASVPRVNEVLSLAPADALSLAYTVDAKAVFASRTAGILYDSQPDVRALLDKLPDTLNGAAMAALSGEPLDPLTWRVTLAAHVSCQREELFRRLTDDIIPAWNRLGISPGHIQFWDDEKLGYLQLAGPPPLFMALAVRDGILFGSTAPGVAEAWRDSGEVEAGFVNGDDFARFNSGRSAPIGTLLYVDARLLMPMVAQSLNQTMPNLYDALQLGRVEFVALLGGSATGSESQDSRTGTRGQRPAPGKPASPADAAKQREPPRPQALRLAVGLGQIEPGPWHLLASTPSPVSLARFFPENTTLLIHGSMARGSSIVDEIAAFAAAIDKEIAREYELECAEFKSEVGLDPHSEFLANFVKEWAFGAQIQPFGEPLLALRLESASVFKAHMHRLRVFYQLGTRPGTYRGVTIEHATRELGSFDYAVVGDVLLVSPDEKAVKHALDAVLDGTGLARTRAFEAVRRGTPHRTSKFVYLDLGALFGEVVDSPEAAEYPEVVKLVETGAAVGLSVVPHERMIALELVTSDGRIGHMADLLSVAAVSSFRRARYLSQRIVSLANVKAIVTACHIYAADHKKQWPRSLDELVASGAMGHETQAKGLMSNPYEPRKDTAGKPYYLYRRILEPEGVKDPSIEVVVSEPRLHDGGAVFGFMDGHAEWVTSPRADELLSTMQSGR